MSKDILLIERGNGGDFVLDTVKNDIVTITGFQNMVYLALFGGNVDQSTKQYNAGEQRFDWWGNSTLFNRSKSSQMNSSTERILLNTALTTQGRLIIEQAVKSDLSFMRDIADVTVSVTFPLVDRVEIKVKLDKPQSEENSELTFLWSSTLNELINDNRYITL
jgi:hypothetical protein